jgi:ubiquitin-like protein ATG12
MASGSPDDSSRQVALPWTPGEVSESATEALQALDTYKKKDPSKGQRCNIGIR